MNPENFEGTPEYYNKQNTNEEKIPIDQEWKQVQAQTNESELNLQQVIHYYQNATDEQKLEIINEMKKAGYADEFILEFLSATDDEFVPKSRR